MEQLSVIFRYELEGRSYSVVLNRKTKEIYEIETTDNI